MKRNHRKNKIRLSILLIVALMLPMLPTFALAEGEAVVEASEPQMAEMQAADQAAAEQAAAEEAARIAAEQAAAEAARIAAEQAAAEEAARLAAEQAAAEEAARIAAEQAAAEEAARAAAEKAAAEEAARAAAEQAAAEEAARAAAEEAARAAAEQAAAEEAARAAAEQAAAEEAARAAAEQAAAEETAVPEEGAVQTDGEEAEPVAEETAQSTATPEPTQIPVVEVTAVPVVVAAAPAMAEAEVSTVIASYALTQKDYYVKAWPETVDKAVAMFPKTLTATLEDGKTADVSVTWACKGNYKESNIFAFTLAADSGYTEKDGVVKPEITLHVGEFEYTENADGTLTITAQSVSSGTTLVIPASIDGKTVSAIGENVFTNCQDLTDITFPDTLKNIHASNFPQEKMKEDVTIRLSVTGKTTLTGAAVFAATPENGGTISDSAKVTLPAAITDIVVEKAKPDDTEGGDLTIAANFTVKEKHALSVDAGCSATVNPGVTLENKGTDADKGTITNKGTINNKGTITNSGIVTNSGKIYSCYPTSTVDASITENVVTEPHSFDENGVCEHCGIQDLSNAEITLEQDAYTYSGSENKPLVTKVALNGADVAVENYTVTYADNVAAGDAAKAIVTATEGNVSYVGSCEQTFVIARKTLTETMVSIPSQTYTGAELTPAVTVTDGTTVSADNYDIALPTDVKCINARDYTIKVTGKGNYTGEVSKTFKIEPKSLKAQGVNASIPSREYSGIGYTPSVTITDGGKTLTSSDYTVPSATYSEVGKHAIEITGRGNYKDTITPIFEITKASIANAVIGSIPNQTYDDGNEIKPGISVTFGSNVLKEGTDYSVTYSNNKDAGTATVTITGIGNFEGTNFANFTIDRKKVELEIKFKSEKKKDLTKVYDKTRNVDSFLDSTFFKYNPSVAKGEKVTISSLVGVYDNPNVGKDHMITATFIVSQTTTKNYEYTFKNGKQITSGDDKGKYSVSVPVSGAVITAKALTLRPGVEKSSSDSTLVPQTKVYGTADPSSYKAKVNGIMKDDKLSEAVSGKLTREKAGTAAGENVGKYRILIGTIKGKGNYDATPILEEGYFEILPKSVNATDVGMVALGNQKYTGAAIEPTITLKYTKKVNGKTETETLAKDKDFTVKYTNNVEPGTATVTITGKGNYTGTRTATFRILKVGTVTAPSTSSTTANKSTASGVSSSVNSSESDDEDDDDEAPLSQRKQQRLNELLKMSDDELKKLAISMGIDPDDFESREELAREILDSEIEESIGELVLDDEPYGTILFGVDDKARPFLLYEEKIGAEDDDDDDDDEIEVVDGEEDEDADDDWDDEDDDDASDREPVKKRLRIEAMNLQDEEGNDLFLDEEETREKYEELHLRLTPNQIDVLKSKNFVELVYQLENAELYISLDELTSEIDVSPFERTEDVQYAAPETESADEGQEIVTELDENGDEIEIVEAETEDQTVLEAVNMEITPSMKEVNQYDFCILQLVDETMTEREKAAIGDMEAPYPYRVLAFAVNGEVKENVSDPVDPDDIEASTEAPAEEDSDLSRYPMLDIMQKDELRITMDDDPEEETRMVFVSDDESIQEDSEAIVYPDANFVEDEDFTYASFAPEHSGMYSVLEEADDFEPLPFVTYGPVNTPVPSATPVPEGEIEIEDEDEDETEDDIEVVTPEPTETPEPTPEPTPTPEPEPEVIEDPDPTYAYSRRSNEGNQYWLVNTVDKTVEYYSAVDDEYWIGDYTGSLMSGMDVETNNGKSIDIVLKFQQTYKFALMNGDGPELLMEQDDVAAVDAELSAHR